MRRVSYVNSAMRDLAILFRHLVVTVARLFGPGGARSIVAESLLVKHPLLILNRSRFRALVKRKYRLLFEPKTRGKPDPTGPSPELVTAILEMKHKNPNIGYLDIARLSVVFSKH